MNLGKLEKIKDLRSVWKYEANDFTKWLAKEENLNTLSEEIGIDIELLSTEVKTGSFSTDILTVETNTNNKIVIENQLEVTNHDHLGKIITYASGHDAKTIIWIVKNAREEHRQAIDWLNEHTDEEINIFLCRIELWRIGNSDIAPKFQIVSIPNNWTKTLKKNTDTKMTSREILKYNYWTQVKETIDNEYSQFNSRTPHSHNFYYISIGSTLAFIILTINFRDLEIKAQVRIRENKDLFDYLYEFKDDIESEMGVDLNWDKSENKKSSQIRIIKKINLLDETKWDESIKWQLDMASKLYDSFSERIKKFKY